MKFVEALVPSVGVSLEIPTNDGKRILAFKIAFDFNALTVAEEKTGISLLNGGIFGKLTAGSLAKLFWAGIQLHHPEYAGDAGLKAIGNYLTLANSHAINLAVQEAYVLSLPEEQQKWINDAGTRAEAKKAASTTPGESPLDGTEASEASL